MKVLSLDLKRLSPRNAGLVKAGLFGLKAAVLAAVLSLAIPNQYLSEARILPSDDASGALGGLSGAAAAFGVNLPFGGGNLDDNLGDILQSRWMMEQLLTHEYEFHEKAWIFGKEQARRQSLYDYLAKPNMDKAIHKLNDKFDVKRDQKTKLYTLTMETYSPELSQQVVRRAVQLLGDFLRSKTKTRGSEKADFAKERLEEARKEASTAEERFKQFLLVNRNYQTSPDPRVQIEGHRLEAEVQLRRQLLSTLALNYENAMMEEKNDVPILNVLDSGNLPIEKSKPWRSGIVLLMFILAGGGYWSWCNRDLIKGLLSGGGEQA